MDVYYCRRNGLDDVLPRRIGAKLPNESVAPIAAQQQQQQVMNSIPPNQQSGDQLAKNIPDQNKPQSPIPCETCSTKVEQKECVKTEAQKQNDPTPNIAEGQSQQVVVQPTTQGQVPISSNGTPSESVPVSHPEGEQNTVQKVQQNIENIQVTPPNSTLTQCLQCPKCATYIDPQSVQNIIPNTVPQQMQQVTTPGVIQTSQVVGSMPNQQSAGILGNHYSSPPHISHPPQPPYYYGGAQNNRSKNEILQNPFYAAERPAAGVPTKYGYGFGNFHH